MNRFQRVLIACSGAVEDVVAQPECRADAKKYAMIGAFVLLTAVFAFFSSTFALYTGVGSLPLAMAIGVAWALMIFTLDRFVVSGIRKSDVDGLPAEQRFKTRLVEWIVALPRIALAALISFVVATPLELRFFQREIDAQLAQNQTRARQTAGEELDREFQEIKTLRAKNEELRQSTAEAWKNHSAADMLAARELAGQALTRHVGDGPVYRRLQARAEDLRRLASQTEKANDAAIARADARIAELEQERGRRLGSVENTINKSGGFLARYGALGQMAEENRDVQVARIFLMLLFLTIELTPVLMKLLQRRGPYDDFMDTLEHRVRVAELTQRSHINDDAHMQVALRSRENSERVQLEETLSRNTFDWDTVNELATPELREAQTTLARASIDEWLRKEMLAFGPRRSPRIPIRTPTNGDEHPRPSPSMTPPTANVGLPAEEIAGSAQNDAGLSV